MTDHIYSAFDRSKQSQRARFEEIAKVWNQLLVATNADIERATRWLEQLDRRYHFFDDSFSLADFLKQLEQRQWIERTSGGTFRLAPGGTSQLRRDALERIFGNLKRGGTGTHRVAGTGTGKERLAETRPFQFGDDVADLDVRSSVRNALRRGQLDFDLIEDDFEVFESEATASCSSVIAIDISHSMTLYGEDRITPAKQVALALVELIKTRYPKDELHVVLFGDEAREVPIAQLPYVSNGPFHTNTRDGLRLASRLLLRGPHPNRQILLITDGKPSALTLEDGSFYKNPFGLDEMVVNKTLEEAANLRRKNIVVTTFMLTDDPYLVDFVDRFTRMNRGRAYYSQADSLGSTVLVDYIKNRKRSV